MNMIPVPPARPSPDWLQSMANELIRLKPDLPLDNALRCAELAHDGTWLLEPAEAAEWWLLAIGAAARHSPRLSPGWRG
jgi:hypothetical protein